MIRTFITRSRFVGGSAVLALLVAAAGSLGARQAAPSARPTAAQATTRAPELAPSSAPTITGPWRNYRFDLEVTSTLPSGTLKQHVTGQVAASLAPDARTELWHIGSLERLNGTGAGASPEIVSVYGSLTISEAGLPERIAFSATEPSEHRKWLEALIALSAMPRALPTAGSRELEERDAAGTYRARYTRVSAGLVRREKLFYTAGSASQVDLRILDDSAELTLGAEQLTGVRAHQHWRLTGDRIDVESRSALELLPSSTAPADASAARTLDASFSFGGASRESERERDDRLTQGQTADAAFAALYGASSPAERGRASEQLSALLRRDPALLPALLEALRAHAQDELGSLLTHTIVDSGAESSIAALTGLLLDTAWPLSVRRNVCTALGLAAPPALVLAPLVTAARADADLAPGALLAIGSALARATEHGTSELTASAFLEQEYHAATATRRGTLLLALGNAGSPALLEELPRLARAKPGERAELIWALRRVPGPIVDRALNHALFDSALEVRKAALRACANQDRTRCRDLPRVAKLNPDLELRRDALRAAAQLTSRDTTPRGDEP